MDRQKELYAAIERSNMPKLKTALLPYFKKVFGGGGHPVDGAEITQEVIEDYASKDFVSGLMLCLQLKPELKPRLNELFVAAVNKGVSVKRVACFLQAGADVQEADSLIPSIGKPEILKVLEHYRETPVSVPDIDGLRAQFFDAAVSNEDKKNILDQIDKLIGASATSWKSEYSVEGQLSLVRGDIKQKVELLEGKPEPEYVDDDDLGPEFG